MAQKLQSPEELQEDEMESATIFLYGTGNDLGDRLNSLISELNEFLPPEEQIVPELDIKYFEAKSMQKRNHNYQRPEQVTIRLPWDLIPRRAKNTLAQKYNFRTKFTNLIIEPSGDRYHKRYIIGAPSEPAQLTQLFNEWNFTDRDVKTKYTQKNATTRLRIMRISVRPELLQNIKRNPTITSRDMIATATPELPTPDRAIVWNAVKKDDADAGQVIRTAITKIK